MSPASNDHARRVGSNALWGEWPRVLIVEDDVLQSLELAQILSEAGFVAIGPARSVAQALELTERVGCQVAVLDVGLRLGTSEPLARELKDRGTPFVALSGYPQNRLPSIFTEAPFLAKPLQPELLISELRRCVNQS
ncbi:MAG: response regulator [Rhodomicrobium sp.]